MGNESSSSYMGTKIASELWGGLPLQSAVGAEKGKLRVQSRTALEARGESLLMHSHHTPAIEKRGVFK